jgi:hypothetical protein
MPVKPAWFSKLDQIIAELEALPCPWVDRGVIEFLLGIGPRRAQQIMAVCITERVGTSNLADRDLLIEHLRKLAHGDSGYYERRRRRKLGMAIEELRRAWLERPKALVEAPISIVNQRFEDLPQGIDLEPGRIVIRFDNSQQALQKLLALAMAIGKDMQHFEQLIGP